MKIEELPSGSYRIRKMYKGKTHTIITDHKPTQKEAAILIAEALQDNEEKGKARSFKDCSFKYISLKKNVLSPSTVREYTRTLNWISREFLECNIFDITNLMIQSEINVFSVNHSPKTVRNLYGFITAVLKTFRPNISISVRLPQKLKKEPYIPTDSDIKAILKECKGSMFEIPIRLACYGLRRSEICALDISDLNKNYLTINKALVQNQEKKWVIKTTKTTGSTRVIYIDDDLASLIRKRGYIYKGFPHSISKYLNRIEDKLNIPHFAIHKLRHYYATMLHDIGIPDSDIMKLGGWSSDYVMKNVYRHSVQSTLDIAQEKAIEHLKNLSQNLS